MSEGMCVICWAQEPVEQHHVAGRANHSRMVPLCRLCHKLVTNEQHRQGIDLSDAWRPYQEKCRAIIVGHLLMWRHQLSKWESNFAVDLRDTDDTIKPPKPMWGIGP